MRSKLYTIIGVFIILANAHAQEKAYYYPKVGEKIIDYTFTDLTNYSGKTCKLSDFRGKWLVLDFWTASCGTCIASFPKINNLNKRFSDQVKILTVGIYDHQKDEPMGKSRDQLYIRNLFATRVKNYNYEFSCAFDSLAKTKFDLRVVPTILIIDPNGIIKGKTWNIDSAQLSKFIKNQEPEYDYVASYHEEERKLDYNDVLPLLTNAQKSNGGIDTAFFYRSLLTKWKNTMPYWIFYGFEDSNQKDPNQLSTKAEAVGFDLSTLFLIAYTGKPSWTSQDSLYKTLSPKLILEVKDTTSFVSNEKKRTSSNSFGYSLQLPAKNTSPAIIRKTLLDDLHRSFHVTSTIEVRKVDVLKLVVTDPKRVIKLKTQPGKSKFIASDDRPGFNLKNWTFDRFIYVANGGLMLSVQNKYPGRNVPPIINETGIDYNVDVAFVGDNRDWIETQKFLQEYGLALVSGKADMKCIVVRDAD